VEEGVDARWKFEWEKGSKGRGRGGGRVEETGSEKE